MSTEHRETSSTGAEKGVKAPRFDLIPQGPWFELAVLFGVGAVKYGDAGNWTRGFEANKTYRSAMSHLMAWYNGEDYDPETGCHHLASVAWHALTAIEMQDTAYKEHPELDNRPKPSSRIGPACDLPDGRIVGPFPAPLTDDERLALQRASFDQAIDVVVGSAEHGEGDVGTNTQESVPS